MKTKKEKPAAVFGEDIVVFGGAGIRTLDGSPTLDDVERELVAMPHLAGDRRHEAPTDTRREFRDERQAACAAQAIGRIPKPQEAFHVVIDGRFALWDMVPAVLTLAEAPVAIAAAHIATLGFSKQNIAELCELMCAKKIETVSILCSHYFKGTSTDIYNHAQAELAKHSQARFLSLRTHAKLIALKLTDGRTVTIESSANLRSCKNIEQMMLSGDPGLYNFHVAWMDELFAKGLVP